MKQAHAGDSAHHRWTTHLAPLLLAWLLASAWGSVVQTQWNLQALVDVGVAVSGAERARMTWQDLIGFAPVYAGIVAAGWLPALPVAAWLARRQPAWRSALLMAAASNIMMTLTHYATGTSPIIFGSGYVSLGTWWRVGFIMCVVELVIYAVLGVMWWKLLGMW